MHKSSTTGMAVNSTSLAQAEPAHVETREIETRQVATALADTDTETETESSVSPALADPLIYWGYLVKNQFMAGELYALSWSLSEWVARDPGVKGMTKGKEDQQVAKWMRIHPRSSDVRWKSERCWIYDHPRAGTVYVPIV